MNQKLSAELRDFEEENESLCKRASDAQSTIMQLETERADVSSSIFWGTSRSVDTNIDRFVDLEADTEWAGIPLCFHYLSP